MFFSALLKTSAGYPSADEQSGMARQLCVCEPIVFVLLCVCVCVCVLCERARCLFICVCLPYVPVLSKSLNVYLSVYMCVCVCTCVCACVCACVCLCVCACVRVYNVKRQLNLLSLITGILQSGRGKTHPISCDTAVTSCHPVPLYLLIIEVWTDLRCRRATPSGSITKTPP